MKIFITGGTGLLGRAVVPALTKQHKCFVLTRKKVCSQSNILINGSLENIDKFSKILRSCDVVLHMANTHTEDLLKICKPHQKFIYISSQNATFKNPGKYSLKKRKDEEIVKNSGLDYLIFRPTLLFDSKGEVYIAKFIRQIIKMPVALQISHGNYYLQPLFVDDFAKVILLGLDKIQNRIIPVAGKEVISIKELTKTIVHHTKIKPIIYIPLWLLNIFGSLGGLSREKIRELDEDKTVNITHTEKEFGIFLSSIKTMLPNIINYVKTTQKTIS